jgi:hypothetical protein
VIKPQSPFSHFARLGGRCQARSFRFIDGRSSLVSRLSTITPPPPSPRVATWAQSAAELNTKCGGCSTHRPYTTIKMGIVLNICVGCNASPAASFL